MSAPVAAIDFGRGVESAWSNVASFVPKFVGFLVILAITFIVAKALGKLVDVVLERVGFDRVVERGGVRAALSRSNYDASDIVAKLVYYAVVLIGLSVAFGVFGRNPISAYLASIVAFIPKVIVAIVIVVVTAFLAKMARDVITGALGGLSYGPALAAIASVAIWFFGVVAALHQINVASAVTMPLEIAVLAALAGTIIVGVGGGLVAPMRSRWERLLSHAEREQDNLRRVRSSAGGPYPTDSAGTATRPLSSPAGAAATDEASWRR